MRNSGRTTEKPTPKRTRKPTKTPYSQAIVQKLCTRIAGGESLRTICFETGMPSKATVFRWLEQYPEFVKEYNKARKLQADSLFDEILDIADEVSNDFVEDKKGNIRVNDEAIQRSRLRIDARKWMAGKLRPKVYGDKSPQIDEDEDDEMPESVTVTIRDARRSKR